MNLLRDFNDLVKAIKKIVVETMETTKPTATMYGQVISSNPLKINVEQRMVLDKNFLILTRNVTDYQVSMKVDNETKTYHVDNSLKTGEKVVLLRQQGGQKFLVIDRVMT